MCSYVQPQLRSQPGLDRERGGLRERRRHLVVLVDVADRPAVAHDVAVEAPLVAQDLASSVSLAQHGSPFVRLYALMMLCAFASVMQA